ncbi:MAG TPA: 4a-hydroxytetrahydrobiopterin dehydratase [Acidimicrobiales bacterium]|nr:4a-hydroxytetrahydrobiopterin dehydratase [Acidimicrobiales bacterium]
MTRPGLLEPATIDEWLVLHPHWRLEESHLVRELATVDYASSVRLLASQVPLADGLDHHPMVELGYRRVRFELWTHDRRGLTSLDLAYAEGLDEIITRDFLSVVTSS